MAINQLKLLSSKLQIQLAAAKLEDGDVKGAVRILCCDEKLAAANSTTLDELCRLHPCMPLDRRPAPSSVVSPLQVGPMAIKKAIQSFPNGSAGGPDGLIRRFTVAECASALDCNARGNGFAPHLRRYF